MRRGGSPTLFEFLAEAAAARAARAAARCLAIVEEATAAGSRSHLEDAIWRLRGIRLSEELAAAEVDDGDGLARLLERLLTAYQIGSEDVALLHGRVGATPHGSEFARLIVTVLCEMLHAAASAVRGARGSEMAVVVDVDDGWLMMTVRTSADADLVLPRDGAAAFARVRSIAGLARGVARRRCEGGRLAMAFTVELSAARLLMGVDA